MVYIIIDFVELKVHENSWKFMSNKKHIGRFFFNMNFHEPLARRSQLTMNSSPIKLGQNRPKQTLNQIV